MATFVTARPVLWADGELAPADAIRLGHAAEMAPGATSLSARGGVLPGPGDPGLISALGTPAMKVHVKAGPYEVPSSSATGGSYRVVVDADADLDIAASDASNPRTDLLIVEVVDTGDATTTSQVRILTGTAGPGAPRPTNTTPNAHWITIGSVDVRALAESSGFIRAQDVHDERTYAVARGGILPVTTSAALPATGYEGERAVETTGASQGQEWEWRAGGWKWPKAAQGQLKDGYDIRAAGVSGVATATPGDLVADLTVTVTVPDSRLVRITVMGQAISTDTTTLPSLLIQVAGVTIGKPHSTHATNNNGAGFTMSRRAILAAGTHSVTVRIARGAGAGTVGLDTNTELLVEDMGAA